MPREGAKNACACVYARAREKRAFVEMIAAIRRYAPRRTFVGFNGFMSPPACGRGEGVGRGVFGCFFIYLNIMC